MSKIKSSIKGFHSIHLHIFALFVSALLGFTSMSLLMKVQADNPTFFLSGGAGCVAADTNVAAPVNQTLTLYVCIDGDNEGSGIKGAETHIGFNPSKVSVANAECNLFDSCIALINSNDVKLLAASGPGGPTASSQSLFGSIKLNFSTQGSTTLSFFSSQIVNSAGVSENRGGVSTTIVVGAPSAETPPAEEPAEEVPTVSAPSASGPIYYISPANATFQEEEVNTVYVGVDTKGQSSNAADMVLTYNAGEIEILSVSPGNAYEGYLGPKVTSGQVRLTAYSIGTPLNGNATFAAIEFKSKPGVTSSSLGFSFSPGNTKDSNIAGVNSNDILAGVNGATYTFELAPVEEPPEEEPEEEPVEEPEEEPEEEPAEGEEEPEEEPAEGEEEPEEEPAEGEEEPEEEPEIHEAAEEFEEEAEEALEQPLQENSDIEIPTAPQNDFCVTNFASNADSDRDGLSDRTECYIGTDPNDRDTDNDTCFDGDELNRFYTSPLVGTDCSVEIIKEKVIITDPKPGWILKALDISGTMPTRSESVGITAFPGVLRELNKLTKDLSELIEKIDEETADDTSEDTDTAELSDELTEELNQLVEMIREDVGSLIEATEETEKDYAELAEAGIAVQNFLDEKELSILLGSSEELTALLESLRELKPQGIFLGVTIEKLEIEIGGSASSGFNLIPEVVPPDDIYDLVATARLPGNQKLSSAPVRITLDSELEAAQPEPELLDNIPITGVQIKIRNGRPVLVGRTVYGAQVFATWESLVLVSSVIADSAEGSFQIQAPEELDPTEDHKVTVYAVMEEEGRRLRSESVTVHFRITELSRAYLGFIILFLLLLLIALMVAKHREHEIDEEAPEHRAKENELYEAFLGEKHIPYEGEAGYEPQDHQKKEKEVKAAFKKLPEDEEMAEESQEMDAHVVETETEKTPAEDVPEVQKIEESKEKEAEPDTPEKIEEPKEEHAEEEPASDEKLDENAATTDEEMNEELPDHNEKQKELEEAFGETDENEPGQTDEKVT